jgi:hypothetical protein
LCGKDSPAALDSSNKACGDSAVANMACQDIDCDLPLRIIHFLCNPLVGDHPRVVLRHRYKDENATSIARVSHVADDKLLKCSSVGLRSSTARGTSARQSGVKEKMKPTKMKTTSCNRKIRCTLYCVKSMSGHGTRSASTLAHKTGTYA